MLRKILLIGLSFLLPLPAFGDIYRWVDEAGVIYFTNIVPSEKGFHRIKTDGTVTKSIRKSSTTYRSTNKAGNHSAVSLDRGFSEDDYSRLIRSISERYEIDPGLVRAVIKVESNFRMNAISRKGARGLMQLMPQTAYELDVKNSFDPAENIEGGVRYLRYLLGIFGGDLSLSLAAYNAGPELVQRLGRVPSIKETQDYVKRVMRLYGGTGVIGFREPAYKIVFDDGTTIFTNTPYDYISNKRYMERM